MKQQKTHFFYRISSWKLAAALFLLFMVIGWAQETYPIGLNYLSELSPDTPILDTSSYSAEDVYPMLTSLSPEAGAYYRRVLLTTDMFFPILFRIMLMVLALQALKLQVKPGHPLNLLALVPLSSMIADILENSLIVVMISQLPEQYPALAAIVSFLTPWKWISNYVEWTIIGGLLISGIAVSLIQKRRDKKNTEASHV